MVAFARREIVDESEVSWYHCISRCVRGAHLMGEDRKTGKNYNHRRDWVYRRVEYLASCFAVVVNALSVMSNHFHLVLCIRPDVVEKWSDWEVARRWLRLSSQKIELREVDEKAVQAAVQDKEKIAKWRKRLCSVSWFMRYLNEPIARMANREDKRKGRFFEERFRSQRLLDEAAVLACTLYADLNLIRACLAQTPEESLYTSAAARIRDRQEWLTGRRDRRHSGWLSPISVRGDGYAGVAAGRRASDSGLFDFDLDAYLQLLDWTGRQLRSDKPGRIPDHLAPILERLSVRVEGWLEGVRDFGRRFGWAVGRPASMEALAAGRGRRWLHGVRACRALFC